MSACYPPALCVVVLAAWVSVGVDKVYAVAYAVPTDSGMLPQDVKHVVPWMIEFVGQLTPVDVLPLGH